MAREDTYLEIRGHLAKLTDEELETRFKFARQKSKLAGTIRGSYFVIKGEY